MPSPVSGRGCCWRALVRVGDISYEQLRSVPILLALLMIAVPMDSGGGELNVWSYALGFQSVYFRASPRAAVGVRALAAPVRRHFSPCTRTPAHLLAALQ